MLQVYCHNATKRMTGKVFNMQIQFFLFELVATFIQSMACSKKKENRLSLYSALHGNSDKPFTEFSIFEIVSRA